MVRETKDLEYKESVTNTFLKTVSAFANYGTGEIVFGIPDDGTVKGLDDPRQACLDIENRIHDSIDPVPEYTLQVNEKKGTVTLTVFEGLYKPYLYKAIAYRRSDSATVSVDRLELSRLILEGQNMSFEELPASSQQLRFDTLQEKLTEAVGLETFSPDTLRTLELYTDKNRTGYNKAAELLADENSFCGVDIVRFGTSINILLDRETLEHCSILRQYDQATEFFRKYYQYEEIQGSTRRTVSLIPEEAFREALANALVHRTWDVPAHIGVRMFADHIEITSPGGLPAQVSKEDYLRSRVSILRNRIIGNIFFRLHLIERFGTGIRRILESYRDSVVKPSFDITEGSIQVTLPVLQTHTNLTRDERAVYTLLQERILSSSMLMEETGFGKTKTVSILNDLVNEGCVYVCGRGRGTKYTAR